MREAQVFSSPMLQTQTLGQIGQVLVLDKQLAKTDLVDIGSKIAGRWVAIRHHVLFDVYDPCINKIYTVLECKRPGTVRQDL